MINWDADDTGEIMASIAQKWIEDFPDGQDDGALVQQVLSGDKSAYKTLVERYQGRTFAVAYGVLRNREDAREMAQEAFIKAYKNLGSFRQDSSFYTWLYRITVNLSIDLQRRAYRNRESTLDEVSVVPDPAYEGGPGPKALPSPTQVLEIRRLGGRIREAIDALPADQRACIVLRELQGLSYKEIAEATGCAEGTVMSRLFYARKRLRELLADAR